MSQTGPQTDTRHTRAANIPAPQQGAVPPRRTRWLLAPSVCAGIALCIVLVSLLRQPVPIPATRQATSSGPTATAGPAAPLVGHVAPPVTLVDHSNQQLTLTHYTGTVVLLNFWYAACDPCRYEMPALEKTYLTDAGRGFVVLGVDTIDDAPTIAGFQQEVGVTYPLLRDPSKLAVTAYRIPGTPTSFLIDRSGVIRAVYVGPVNPQTLRRDLAPLLAATR